MKRYSNWEDMVNEQAIAFAALCARDGRISELAEKDDSEEGLTGAEMDEFFQLTNAMMDNPFFACRCAKEWEELETAEENDDDAYADQFIPNDDDDIWNESPIDLFGPWWE